MNLWDIYKGFYQRSYRNKWDKEAEADTELIHLWLKDMFFCESGHDRKSRVRDGLAIADVLHRREMESGARIYLSVRLRHALQTATWTLKIPYTHVHRWNSERHGWYGDVYVLVDPERPGQFKVGATTIQIQKRVNLYRARYWTDVKVFQSIPCRDPFGIEEEFLRVGIFKRVSGNTSGESNEWYFGDAAEAVDFLHDLIAASSKAKSRISARKK